MGDEFDSTLLKGQCVYLFLHACDSVCIACIACMHCMRCLDDSAGRRNCLDVSSGSQTCLTQHSIRASVWFQLYMHEVSVCIASDALTIQQAVRIASLSRQAVGPG